VDEAANKKTVQPIKLSDTKWKIEISTNENTTILGHMTIRLCYELHLRFILF